MKFDKVIAKDGEVFKANNHDSRTLVVGFGKVRTKEPGGLVIHEDCFYFHDEGNKVNYCIDMDAHALGVLHDRLNKHCQLNPVRDYAKEKRTDLLKKHVDVSKSAAFRRLKNTTDALRTIGQNNLADKLQSDIDILMK